MRFTVTPRLSAWARPMALGLLGLLSAGTASAAAPTRVTLVGDFQSELGCSVDGDTACTSTDLTYDADDEAWQASFTVPAGTWSYRVALDAGAGGTYGKGATLDGEAITLTLGEESPVKFYFDHTSHWAASRPSSTDNEVIAIAPGSFQSELGCPGDWQQDCLRSWLQDPDGDGIYTRSVQLPEGSYESKVALDESWAVNYGANGAPGGANIGFSVPAGGSEVIFKFNAETKVPTVKVVNAPSGDLRMARAHWVSPDTLLWNPEEIPQDASFKLHYDPTGSIVLGLSGLEGGQSLPLTLDPAGPSEELEAKFPHLASYKVLKLSDTDVGQVPELLKGQVAVSLTSATGVLLDATSLQLPGVLDALYANDEALGVTWKDGAPTLALWAPTAKSVRLHLFEDSDPATTSSVQEMTVDPATGVWSLTGEASWKGKFYLYEVEVYVRSAGAVVKNLVTDPYSLSLSTNSKRSQIVDLSDEALKPESWDALKKPVLAAPEDIVLYELHVRDFSINDASVPEEKRGTFAAFAEKESNGMKHLKRLAGSGLTHVHLLPVFDIATINENRAEQLQPEGDLAAMAPDSEEQQAAVAAVKDLDGFNWGYDPYHYTVPEGSYATEPDGSARILEFRQMVGALASTGLRVVMDVVYNHTNASGQGDKSVLDKVVPGYYHRLNADGNVERSTCCENTATEHAMMEKLMVDSVVTWARAYKVDGFRFDLMGHHMKANMVKVRDALRALTLEKDGVDGSKLYLYGEGWNFGEVGNNQRGVNATQLNMGGTGIGTFSDRLRDAARGGGPFSGLQEQGFINGLWGEPNGITSGTADEQRSRLLLHMDQIRVGLAGNLKDYTLVDRNGETVPGSGVLYGDGDGAQPAGYTLDPEEVITYVSAHDNETLFDAVQLKAPPSASLEDRVRMHSLGLSLVLLGQGIPFIHAGDELLRSKSMDRDSYNSGDWFNKLDFTYQSNNWGVGLPPAGHNEQKWALMKPLLADPALEPSGEHILAAFASFEDMLRIRKSTEVFRLRTAQDVREKVRFHNTGSQQVPGLIVMSIIDEQARDGRTHVVVLFNANAEARSFRLPEYEGRPMQLHPVQQGSKDARVREASFQADGTFSVPARTTAVFVNLPAVGDGPGCGGCSGTGGGALSALALLLGAVLLSRRRQARL